ncbi:MAG TPA: EamA family transporter [Methylomirabilota bacterium]|nr:EamA family transporter [Methylomirabilota bacterium]
MPAAAQAIAADNAEPPILKVAPQLFVAMWSTGFIGAKYGAPVADPFSLLFLRFVFVLPILGLVVVALRRPWPQLGAVDGFSMGIAGIALASVAAIAFGTVYSKRTGGGADLVTSTVLQFVGAAVVLLPAAALEGFHYVPSMQLALVLGWLVLVLSIGAVMLLLLMVRHGAVSKVATLFYLVPPTTAGFAWLLFDETLTVVQLLGAAAVVGAVFVATRSPAKKPPTAR